MSDTIDSPIFIVSAPRSGSTLLRLIIDANPNIAIPPPGYLFNMIYPYIYSYGDLAVTANLIELAEDFLETPTLKKWGLTVDPAAVVAGVKERSFKGVYEFVHRVYMQGQGKVRWGNKSPRNVHFIPDIKALFPGAKIVHLLRDGRDVAIEIAEADFWPHSVWGGAQRWLHCIRAARVFGRELDADSFLELKYESLCRDPEPVLRRLCDFLNEPFDPGMLSHHTSASTRTWAKTKIHQATAKPITTEFVEAYKRRLNQHDQGALEALLGETLQAAGYEVSGRPQALPYKLATQIEEGDAVSALEKAEYKTWHKSRRARRRQNGVWRDEDRQTQLWGMV